jgi:hypothetical protein
MRRISLLLALVASLFVTPALADFTGKDASLATITFKNPGACASVVCVPVFQLYDGTNVVTLTTAGADGVSNTLTGLPTYDRMLIYNGTTWDRWQGAIKAGANAFAAGSLAIGAGVDGWNITEGVTTDAASTAGGTGTQSAKLRLMTTQLNSLALNQSSQITQETATAAALGTTADAVCGSATGTCTLAALVKFLNNAATAATPAGENHIGEIASNQIKVQVAQTVTAASAYAAGNAIGGLQTIAGAARVSGSLGAAGTGGILTGLMMNSKSLQTTQVDVFLFDANPSGSTCTDKTAFSLATADFDKVIGVVTIPGTAANGAGWYAGTVGSTGVATYYPVTYDLASASSIFACAVTRGTPTYTATTDVSFKYNILRN